MITTNDGAREIARREVLEWDEIEQAAGTTRSPWSIQRERLIARIVIALDVYAADRERAGKEFGFRESIKTVSKWAGTDLPISRLIDTLETRRAALDGREL